MITLIFSLVLVPIRIAHAQTEDPVVHAVLFFSPSCPHCHLVLNETITSLIDQYGDQLQIIAIDVTQPNGEALFLNALKKFDLEYGGVPLLVIGNTYLLGSLEIPTEFPSLIEAYLAQGGVDWPDISGLQEGLAAAGQTENSNTAPPSQTITEPTIPESAAISPAIPSPMPFPNLSLSAKPLPDPNWRDLFAQDLGGNTLSVIVLIGMVGAVLWSGRIIRQANRASLKDRWAWVIPILSIAGICVSAYLAYVETMQVEAVCGPVGDCNTVQHSEYARLFGVLPIGVLGLGGYIAIITTWLMARYMKKPMEDIAAWALLALTISGTIFSIYLTFLEPFVIGATCTWCLTSSVLITLLMLASMSSFNLNLSRISSDISRHRRH